MVAGPIRLCSSSDGGGGSSEGNSDRGSKELSMYGNVDHRPSPFIFIPCVHRSSGMGPLTVLCF